MDRSTKRIIALSACLLSSLYTGSYAWLSSEGRYEPAVFGTGGVKWYRWAPKGFMEGFTETRFSKIYLPLWALDHHYWHTSDEAHDGHYPINEVKKEDIGKVYRAYTK